MKFHMKNLAVTALCFGLASVCSAQNAPATQPATPPPAAPAAPAPLPTPSITGPLSGLPPAMFDAGFFGKIAVNGFLTGLGMVQNNPVPGDDTHQAALSNGQIIIQKTDGVFQFYLQAGAYTLPDLSDSVSSHRQNGEQLLWPGASGLC